MQFFTHLLYVIDFVVVVGSIALELSLHNNPTVMAMSQVVIFVRLWRLVRIGHGLYTRGLGDTQQVVEALEDKLKLLESAIATQMVEHERELSEARSEARSESST